MAYSINGSIIIDDSRNIRSAGVVTAVTYFGDGTHLTGVTTISANGDSITGGIATFQSDVVIDQNLTIGGDITTARNINATGIATVNDLYIDNLLYDSNGNVGAAGSILVTTGGKLQWLPPDQAGIATVFQPGNTYFVSSNGDDDSDGLSVEKSFATIAYALSQIPTGENSVLLITAGEYEEVFPLSVPDGLTVKGVGQRSVFVKPTTATETNDGFLLGNASTVEDLTIGSMLKPQSGTNYAFKFRSGATISSRGPYVQRVTILNKGTEVTAADPFGYGSANAYPTTAPGGAGVLADGSVLNAASLEASFLLNEVTMFVAGNIGLDMINGARVEWLNGFIYFASEAVKGRMDQTSGLAGAGKARLTLENASGGLLPGNVVELYDVDNVTGIATGTIDSVSGSYVYLTDGGTGTFTEAGTRTAKAISFVDTARLSTLQARFGNSSLDVTQSTTDCLNVDPSSDFGFGTGDFTVEFWYRRTAANVGNVILDMRDAAASDVALAVVEAANDALSVTVANGAVLTSGNSSITNDTWHHIAVARDSGTMELFIDGSQEDSASVTSDLAVSRPLTIGADYTNADGTQAYIDELRITKGAAKYTTAFIAPSAALKGDRATAILLHLDGLNGATTTSDDIIVYQDIRISGSNTADRFTLADYSEFGADLRGSSCAVEYGNQGVIGDGKGVTLRLISMNFSFVGALGDITNDPALAVQTNEVTELNDAEVSYTSIDHKGDFRVGESFYVNQETGEVSFSDTTTDLTSLSTLTITDGTNNSVITPTSGRFGNIQISGQQVASVAGDVDIVTAGAGEVNIYGNTNVIGILTAQVIQIDALQKGDTGIALEDTGSDGTIRFNTDGTEAGRFTKDQDLAVTNNFRIGGIGTIPNLVSSAATITNATITTLTVDNIVSGGSTGGGGGGGGGTGIGSTSISSPNINISGQAEFNNVNISGVATVPDLTVTNSFTNTGYSTITGDMAVGGNLWLDGDLNVIGSQNVSEFFATNMEISGIATFGTVYANNDVHCADTVFVGGAVTVSGPITAVDIVASGVGTIPVADVGHADVDSINVTGVSTISQVNIGKITVGDFDVTGIATVAQIDIQSGVATLSDLTVGDIQGTTATFTGNVSIQGNTTLGDSTADFIAFNGRTSTIVPSSNGGNDLGLTGQRWRNVYADDLIITDGATLGGDLGVTGDTTITGDLDVDGHAELDDANISGIATVAFANIVDLNVSGVATVGGLDFGGAGSIGTEGVDINSHTSLTTLEVSGVSTFNGGVDALGGLYVQGGLAADVAAFTTCFVEQDLIGKNGVLETLGVATLTATNQTSLAALSVSGIATFAGDVEIGGNLTLTGDLQYDEVNGRNANITGVGTVGTLGVTSSLTVGELTTLQDLSVVGASTFTGTLDVDGQAELDNLNVSGVSTFVGVSSFKGDVYIDGNLIIDGDNSQDLVSGTNLLVTGIATIGTLGVTTDLTVGNTVTAERFVGMGSGLTHLPPASFLSTEAPTVRPDGSAIQPGDLWFDVDDLRQFTRYAGVGTDADIWVDSNPAPTIPDLQVRAGAGQTSAVDLVGGTLDIVGTANEIDTVVTSIGSSSEPGAQVQVGLTSDVLITRNLGVGGTITADTLVVANFEVDGDGLVFEQAKAVNVLVSGVSSVTTQYINAGFATNFTVSDTFTLVNPVNSIGITSDLGGAGAAHTALVSQRAIKEYVDNRINIIDQDLEFQGDTGSGIIGIATEALAINGTAEQIETVGAGNSVTIGLPNATRVQQRLTVGGDLFTQVADFSATNGTTFSNKIVTFNAPATFGANDIQTLRNIQSTGIATFNQVSFTGIITTTGNAFVGGDLSVAGDVTANDYNSTSDENKKENIAEIDDALAKVLDLRGVTFDWKNGSGSSAGVIAQEVEKILPEIVKGDAGDMTVQYNGIIALLVQAVKELSAEVEHLKETKSDKRRKKS